MISFCSDLFANIVELDGLKPLFAGFQMQKTAIKVGDHICVAYELIAVDEKSLQEVQDYLKDYAKISMAKKVVYE